MRDSLRNEAVCTQCGFEVPIDLKMMSRWFGHTERMGVGRLVNRECTETMLKGLD